MNTARRRNEIRRAGVLVLSAVMLAAVPQPDLRAAEPKPNILFILTDDQRWDTLGCYGNTVIRTPNLDALAAEGARLDAFCVAFPLCCPSRATFLTGRYSHQNGVGGNDPPKDPVTPYGCLASHLRAAGYVSGFVGKAHLAGDPRAWLFTECPIWSPGGAANHHNPTLSVAGMMREVPGEVTQIYSDAAIEFLERNKARPWFLWLATTAPHAPYERYPAHPYESSQIVAPPGWPKTQPLGKADWAGYYSTISMLDEQIGRVLKKLNELGLEKNTFVLVTSDNGFMHGSHELSKKSVWHEESVRVPALARWPGKIKPGTTLTSPVSSVDWFPTVLELAGLEPLKGMEAVSMLPALLGRKALRSFAFAEGPGGHARAAGRPRWRLVRNERWKYVRVEPATEFLFDLQTDPHEQIDLATSKSHARQLPAMRRQMDQWLKQTAHPRPPAERN